MRTRLAAAAATALLLATPLAAPAAAQRFSVGVGAANGTYQEQGDALAFTGWGPEITATAAAARWQLWMNLLRISYKPTSGSAGAEPFDLTLFDGRVRYAFDSTWSAEIGYQQQNVAPSDAAQQVRVIPVGGRVGFTLAPGARISANVDYLAAARFSGGGSAPFAMEVGLQAYYAPGAGALRFTVGYAFDRIDRQTTSAGGTLPVPIQSSVVQLGLALTF
ncbi:MAG TPA: hypothetical protein VMT93_04690 [Gemmatimonadaceae bacterium]|nr:hypothetical protein [Gemmatimonadaceae bacterium]